MREGSERTNKRTNERMSDRMSEREKENELEKKNERQRERERPCLFVKYVSVCICAWVCVYGAKCCGC